MKGRKFLCVMGSIIVFQLLWIVEATSAVHFITKNESSSSVQSTKPCIPAGYKFTAKNCKMTLSDACPTDSTYFRLCSCGSSYKFDSTSCKAPKVLGANLCGEKSDKCECPSEYNLTSAQCEAKNMKPDTVSCDNKYAKCVCSSEYSEVCSGNKIGEGLACDKKYKSCKCDRSKFAESTCNNGHIGESCSDSSGVYYQECKAGCLKTAAMCAASIGGVAADWSISGTGASCECTTTKKYVIMQDMKPTASAASYYPSMRRIKAVKNFGSVKYGDLGGYIEKESNLSQTGNSWVGCDSNGCAWVMGDAQVFEDAQVYGGPNGIGCYTDSFDFATEVHGNAQIYGNAKVYGGSRVYTGKVYGNAIMHGLKRYSEDDRDANACSNAAAISGCDGGELSGSAQMFASSYISGSSCGSSSAPTNPKVYGNAIMGGGKNNYNSNSSLGGNIQGNVKVYGYAKVLGNASASGNVEIYDNAVVKGGATLRDDVKVYGSATVGGAVYIQNSVRVYGNAVITPPNNSGGSGIPYICRSVNISGTAKVTNPVTGSNKVICKNSYSSGEVSWQKGSTCSTADICK